ncbi:hypothetical protein I4F81_006505 [Pyropia yezoensis]|uniref:Uncharacterized protein n=1 Tax=Pyropia yezoensis TaxID=2788 RepID=A0ACC3C269_PYRYE|nr:hypothetical protein I4F81_006505 [Neopyropia yezoensis]
MRVHTAAAIAAAASAAAVVVWAPVVTPATAQSPFLSAPRTVGTDATPPSATFTRPPLAEARLDAAYGSTVRRLTTATTAGGGGGIIDSPRTRVENADGTLFLARTKDTYAAYAVADGSLVAALPADARKGNPSWHPSDAATVWYVESRSAKSPAPELRRFNVRTLAAGVAAGGAGSAIRGGLLAAYPAATAISTGSAGGGFSADGARHAWAVWSKTHLLGLIAVDVPADAVLGTASSPERGQLAEVSVSPSGEHVVVAWFEGTYVYDTAGMGGERLIHTRAELGAVVAGPPGGADVWVQSNLLSSTRNGGWLEAVDLATSARARLIDLFAAGTSVQVSGGAVGVPGWALVSTSGCKTPGAWTCNKLLAVNVASAVAVHLAHTHHCGGGGGGCAQRGCQTQTSPAFTSRLTRACAGGRGRYTP